MGRKKLVRTRGGDQVALLIVRDGRHPWVVALLVSCVLAGVLGLTGTKQNNTPIDLYVPSSFQSIYYGALIIAGLVTLVGIWLPDMRDRLMVEQIGLWLLCAPLLLYPIAVVTVYSGPFGVGGIISSLIGVGGLVRILEIIRELHSWVSNSERPK